MSQLFVDDDDDDDEDHLFWSCRGRKTSGAPRDVLQQRLGWPAQNSDLDALQAMSDTVETVWLQRHQNAPFKREYKPKGFRLKPVRRKRRFDA